MTEILQIFSGNPLSTFIGKKIEAATRPELESEDWALNLEICDLINENDDDAKDAVRAIKKRLQQIENDRNFVITNRTLTVLETCVSNCSRRFHLLVMTKDFIQDLVKLIGPKNNPPTDLQERVLRLIKRWAEAFRDQPDLAGVGTVYNELKIKGVIFPPRDLNSNAPIRTPQRSVPPRSVSPQTARTNSISRLQSQQIATPPPQSSGPIVLEGEGYNKISQDLGVVQSSVDMFNEIMQLLESKSDDSDWKLASDLNSTCRQMKERIVDLIDRIANEDLTIELLRLNDDLNNIFIKYDRLVKNHSKSSNSQITPATGNPVNESTALDSSNLIKGSEQHSQRENELSLIDFNADDSGDNNQSNEPPKTAADIQVNPFDASAFSSSNRPSSSKPIPSDIDNLAGDLNRFEVDSGKKARVLPEEVSSVREQDFAEIENWLSTDSGRDLASIGGDMPSIEPVSIANSEFDNFIASRAMAGSSAFTNTTPASGSSVSKLKSDAKPEPSM